MAYDIEYDGDDHEHLAIFLQALIKGSGGAWCVQVTHASTPDGDPTEVTADYALLAISPAGNAVLRPWPGEEGELPEDTGADIEVSADQISKLRIY